MTIEHDSRPVPLSSGDIVKMFVPALVSTITALLIVAAGYGGLNSRVDALSKAIDLSITRREVDALAGYQQRSSADIISRLSQIEGKLDRMTERNNK